MKKLLYLTALLFIVGSQAFAKKYSIIYSDFGTTAEWMAEGPGDSTVFTRASQSSQAAPFDSKIINGRLQIVLRNTAGSAIVALHDILGNKVFEAPANENVEWSLAGLKSGIYILVWKENRASFTKRIVFRQEN